MLSDVVRAPRPAVDANGLGGAGGVAHDHAVKFRPRYTTGFRPRAPSLTG